LIGNAAKENDKGIKSRRKSKLQKGKNVKTDKPETKYQGKSRERIETH
jgi:hypothetical protein